ncbi:MAG: RhuM family protein [Bacteroidales bacterium]|nr:RhuM family protein [Bacteroidales bacterium]
MARDGNIWMNQNQLAELFNTSKQNIGQHIKSVLEDRELEENSVVKNYFTTASDGKNYTVTFYSLDMVLAIGFRVRSKRGTQFRIWANNNLKEFIVKGFAVDEIKYSKIFIPN